MNWKIKKNKMDNDLISRQAAIDEIGEWIDTVYDDPESIAESIALRAVRNSIKRLPAADVRPVVLCRDCKYYNTEERLCNDLMGFGRYWEPDDFCSYADVREAHE